MSEMIERQVGENEVGSVWRCGVGDVIAAIDKHLTHPLKNSRRKAERDLGERVDDMMQTLFKMRMDHSPGCYSQAVSSGKALIAALDQPA